MKQQRHRCRPRCWPRAAASAAGDRRAPRAARRCEARAAGSCGCSCGRIVGCLVAPAHNAATRGACPPSASFTVAALLWLCSSAFSAGRGSMQFCLRIKDSNCGWAAGRCAAALLRRGWPWCQGNRRAKPKQQRAAGSRRALGSRLSSAPTPASPPSLSLASTTVSGPPLEGAGRWAGALGSAEPTAAHEPWTPPSPPPPPPLAGMASADDIPTLVRQLRSRSRV